MSTRTWFIETAEKKVKGFEKPHDLFSGPVYVKHRVQSPTHFLQVGGRLYPYETVRMLRGDTTRNVDNATIYGELVGKPVPTINGVKFEFEREISPERREEIIEAIEAREGIYCVSFGETYQMLLFPI